MKVIIAKNYEEMSAKASRFALSQLWRKPNLVLGLATGETPKGMYKKLAQAHRQKRADFSRVTTFNLDEYVGLRPSSRHSYRYFMQSFFFRHVNVPAEQINIPLAVGESLESAAGDYEAKIKAKGGLDLCVLGIGQNGHIGFNEPGSVFDSSARVIKLSENTRQNNAKYFKKGLAPMRAITMGLGTIMSAKKIILLGSGNNKAWAIARAVEGPVSRALPASVLQAHPDVTFILDQEAASKLKHDYASPFLFAEGDVEFLTSQDLPANKNIAVISPHPDDASISLGGIISALVKKNRVYIIAVTTGYRGIVGGKSREEVVARREQEARTESMILGAKPIFMRAQSYDAKNAAIAFAKDVKMLLAQFKRLKPDMVFLPQAKDSHPTHNLSRRLALSGLSKYRRKKNIALWEYEGLWSVFSEGDFNTIFSFDEDVMAKKIKAITSQKSQINRTRFDVAAKALAQLRAAVVPEQALVGYGAKAPRLGKYFELFSVH